MRSLLFNLAYWPLSIFYTLWAALAALRPGQAPVRRVIRRYVAAMNWAMRDLAGIQIEVRGRERLPAGDFILAPKHASWGDGFSIYNLFDDVAFVTGDHLERYPLMKGVLRKLGAIVVETCGDARSRANLTEKASAAGVAGRKLLIYPEGALAPVGVRYRYRSGVWHMARDFGLPVVPVASSLGLFWTQEAWKKTPGHAVLEFLEPMEAGEDRNAFLRQLETVVEDRTAELIAEARGGPAIPAVRGEPEDERKLREKRAKAIAAQRAA